jgi:chaperonin cofactor prefoldin
MEEHDERADELEREVDDLQHQGDQVEQHIDDARSDLDQKLGDQKAPGLLDEESAAPGGPGEDE